MNIKLLKNKNNFTNDIVMTVFVDNLEKSISKLALSKNNEELLKKSYKKWNFNAKAGKKYSFECMEGNQLKNITLYGLGEIKNFKINSFKRTVAKIFRALKNKDLVSYTLYFADEIENLDIERLLSKMYLGLSLSEYQFNKYKTDEESQKKSKDLNIYLEGLIEKLKENELEKILKDSKIILDAVNKSRDLLNEIPMKMYPETLKDEVVSIFKKRKNVELVIHDYDEINKLGLNLLSAVGMGSDKKPYFVEIHYKSENKNAKNLALVGKGLTYDSGGYSLKPSDYMAGMHMDMGGASMMIGAMDIITNYKLDYNVSAYLVMAENMISGNAYKNSDVITGYGKKSVEVLNTDAEGRLALSDGIAYACDKGADMVIEASTLTGACLVALGDQISAIISNSEELPQRFKNSYVNTEEKFWELPFEEAYKEDLKSSVADLRNIGKTRYGGTITAGLFLSEFVTEGVEYMHLDIAGPAMLNRDIDFYCAGGSGFGVQALAHFIKSGNVFGK